MSTTYVKLQTVEERVVYDLDISFISGVALGIEHVNLGDEFEDGDVDWAVVLDLFIIRFTLFKLKQ